MGWVCLRDHGKTPVIINIESISIITPLSPMRMAEYGLTGQVTRLVCADQEIIVLCPVAPLTLQFYEHRDDTMLQASHEFERLQKPGKKGTADESVS